MVISGVLRRQNMQVQGIVFPKLVALLRALSILTRQRDIMENIAAVSNAQIKAARELLGLTQTDLAAAAGLSLRTIATIEAGRGNPQLETVHSLLGALSKRGIRFSSEAGLVGVPPGLKASASRGKVRGGRGVKG